MKKNQLFQIQKIKIIRSFSPFNNKTDYLKTFSYRYNQTEYKCSNDNSEVFNINAMKNNYNNNQTDLDIKINNYINSIYKHNFARNETNICDFYSLNKTESLYDEIFHKKMNLKNNELYVSTDPCLKRKKSLYSNINNSNNKSQRNISSLITKRPVETTDDKRKNIKYSSSMVNIKNKINYDNTEELDEDIDMNDILNNDNNDNKYLRVNKKNHDTNMEQNSLNDIKNYKSFKKKNPQNKLHTSSNAIRNSYNTTGLKKKIKRNYHYIPLNRSPFLVNKF